MKGFMRVWLLLSLAVSIVLTVSACSLASETIDTSSSEEVEEAATEADRHGDHEHAGQKVVFVNSYHEGYQWSDDIEQAVLDVFEPTGVETRFIRMDTKNNLDEAFRTRAGEEARDAILDFAPDVIIACDDNAQQYLIVPYFMDSEIPVVFCGVNWDASGYGYPNQHITGMIEIELIEQLVHQLAQLTEGSEVAYVTAASETEDKIIATYNERFFDGNLTVYETESYQAFLDAFLEAQEQFDLVLLGNNAGLTDWQDEAAETFFLENTAVPTGSVTAWFAPYVLITMERDPFEQGEFAAQTTLDILDGTSPADIPVVSNARGKVVVNVNIAGTLELVLPVNFLRHAELYGENAE